MNKIGVNFKKMVRGAVVLLLAILLIHVVHALTLDRMIEYKEVSFYSPRWPAALNGYQIAFITDTHRISDEALQGVVTELNARQTDILLLGGDFWFSNEHYRRSLSVLSQVATTDGIFGIEGNHDDYVRLFAAMEECNMVPLYNSGMYIRDGFYLVGIADLWNGSPNIIAAAADAAADDFVLLLAHNPDVTMQQDTTGVDLVLSGHTHGGQITFFGKWAPYFTLRSTITSYGQRFVSGWSSSRDGVPVYVSNGTGEYTIRVFARPQVILLTMRNGIDTLTDINTTFWGIEYKYLALIIAIWNIITFSLYGIDKGRARKNKWRISETSLIICAFLMGGVGGLLGMSVFHHKTQHLKFKLLVPLAIIVNVGVIVGFLHYMGIN